MSIEGEIEIKIAKRIYSIYLFKTQFVKLAIDMVNHINTIHGMGYV